MSLRGGKNKHHMGRRLLQCLQKGIKSLHGKHVYLINDVHLVPAVCRSKFYRFPQVTDFINASIGSRIYLEHIHRGSRIDFQACFALIAGIGRRPLLTVQCLGKDFCRTGLAGAPGTGKKIGMPHLAGIDGIGQGSAHMLLPHQFIKTARPPLPIKCHISHSCHLRTQIQHNDYNINPGTKKAVP